MKKKAGDLVKGDRLIVGDEVVIVEAIEISEMSKQGSKKCRIEAIRANGERMILVRPTDYPLNVE